MVTSLRELTKAVLACTSCPLYTEGMPVVGNGPTTADVMFIGEAPGETEQRTGIPFSGRAGKLLNNQLLPLAGIERSQVRVTNTVLHRPPNNRDPSPEEISACKHWLDIQLELVNPRVVILLGHYAIEAVLGLKAAMKDVNGVFVRKDDRLYMMSIHPAAALHQASNRKLLVESFSSLGRVLNVIGRKEHGNQD